MSDNRFKDVISAARERESQPQQPPAPAQRPQPMQQEPRRGRPPGGKRQNPDYEQVTAYIRKDTYRRVKIRLLEMDRQGEFSELVEVLLTRWLQGRQTQE